MTTFTESHARLSEHAYPERENGEKVNIEPFRLLRTVDRASGYHGVIYQNKDTGELVVSHRGTEFEEDRLRDLIQTDGQMAFFKKNQQIKDARDTTELALELAQQEGRGGIPVSVTVTGHSLGGTLAQITAAEYGLRGETFNAYGAAGLYGTSAGGDLVVNHVRATDMVSAAGKHFGSVRVYATPFDEQMIYREASRSAEIPFPLGLAPLNPMQTHDMAQFYGENSIIRPENVQRYEKNKTIYDEYRQDIRETALAVRYGMPLASAVPGVGSPVLNLYAYEAASYVSHGLGRALSKPNGASPDDERPWGHKLQPDATQPVQGPPLRPCRDRTWDYDEGIQQIDSRYRGHGIQPPPPGASCRELFDYMCTAMETGDERAFKQAMATVADAPSNREFWAHISTSVDADVRQAELQAQVNEQALQMQQMAQRGPVMSRGFSL